MSASNLVKELDEIQKALRPLLKERGFRVRGRSFNRLTEDGLTQVITIQMGRSDPPGTTYIPGLRENLYGLFTLNLGVYIPEVSELQGSGSAKSWIQEYHCSIRSRLGRLSGSDHDIWWHIHAPNVADELRTLLLAFGFPFLERFRSRELILSELQGHEQNLEHCLVPRIVSAIILAKQGKTSAAKSLLAAPALQSSLNPGHPAYVRSLAQRMGLGEI